MTKRKSLPVVVEKVNPFETFVNALAPTKVEEQTDVDDIWEYHPPHLEEFVNSEEYLGLPPLSAHQLRALQEGFERDGVDFFTQPDNETAQIVHEIILIWGKGCIAGETLLTDLATDTTHTAATWARLGQSLTLATWDGQRVYHTISTPVYKKGTAPLFRVVLNDGRSIRVTAKHRFHTPKGWQYTDQLKPGDRLLALPPRTGNVPLAQTTLLPLDRPLQFVATQNQRCVPSWNTTPQPLPQYTVVVSITQDGMEDFYDLTVTGTHCYFDTNGILSHNSGKDMIAAIVIAYLAYIVLCLRTPQQYFSLSPRTHIDIANVATREEQGSDIFFSYLETNLRRTCFTKFKPHFTKHKVLFYDKRIRLHSLHSQAEKWEGYNLIAWVMDEADAFQTAKGTQNADKIHHVLRSSANTRFPGVRWVGFIISYPRSEAGFLLKYAKQADLAREEGQPFAYVDRGATWDVHPHYDPTHVYYQNFKYVTVHDKYTVPQPFASEFTTDPTLAAMTYLCEPPPVEGAFFEFPDLLELCNRTELQPALWVVPRVTFREVPVATGDTLAQLQAVHGAGYTGIEERRFSALSVVREIRQGEKYSYFLHGDPGEVKDSFALCLGHTLPDTHVLNIDEREVIYNRVVIDLLLEWKPDYNRTVDYINVREIIMHLCRAFNVVQVTFDKFQSQQVIQELIQAGINARSKAFSNSEQLMMYRALKALVYGNLIEWPAAHWEMLRPQLRYLILKGNKITHDEAVSGKDVADSLATVAYYASGAALGKVGRLVMETVYGNQADPRVGYVRKKVSA